ncbi:syncoilin-like [Cololabis saira]|uniref:syncoilin-like n=1 Tax=Cololabis saira TaxID=129043 RepID=UPI002AD27DE0|nr:syncoilin-like [Cololabis saira]
MFSWRQTQSRTATSKNQPVLIAAKTSVSRNIGLLLTMDDQRLVETRKERSSVEDFHVDDISEDRHTDSETDTEGTQQHALQEDQMDVDTLGQLFEHCIQQVSVLEKKRDELIQELLSMQDPMLRVVQHLRGRLSATRRLLTLAQLDYITVYEDVQQVKSKLFATARDCIQSQVTLATQKYEVAQSALTQEELQAQIQSLTEDLSQLKDSHRNQLNSIRDQTSKLCRPRAMSDVGQCRQASIRLQRRLSGSVKALEGWYEPRLLVQLKRRQTGEAALRNYREQAMDLRAKLGPLRECTQRLVVQRSCLLNRITLMETEQEESIAQHKVTVEKLREILRELHLEFDVQRKSKRGLEELKEGLLTELTFLRGKNEATGKTEKEQHKETKPQH